MHRKEEHAKERANAARTKAIEAYCGGRNADAERYARIARGWATLAQVYAAGPS